jgi:chromosome segregation ATPase
MKTEGYCMYCKPKDQANKQLAESNLALRKRIKELEEKLDYPHEEIAELQARVKELEEVRAGAIDNVLQLGAENKQLQARVKELEEALQSYIDKFGNCGAVYVQALEAMQGGAE